MVVFSTPTKSGRGLAIISDTSDKGNRSPSHYLFVFLDCLSTATTPLIFLFDSSRFHLIATSPPLLSLLPSYFLVFCCPSSPPLTFLSFDRLSFPGLLWVLTSLFVSSKTPSLQRSSLVVSSHFLSFLFFLPVGLSQLAGCVGLRGPGAAEHG